MTTATIAKPVPRVKEVMHEGAIRIAGHTSLQDVARIFSEYHISGAPVVDEDGTFIGVISLADLARHMRPEPRFKDDIHFYRQLWFESDPATSYLESVSEMSDARTATARELMTPTIVDIDENAPLTEAMQMMLKRRIHRLFVSRETKVVGLVTTMDIMQALSSFLEAAPGTEA